MTDQQNGQDNENRVQKQADNKTWKERWAYFSNWLWSTPPAGESKIKQYSRAVCRIHIIVYQEFFEDKILLRASALTFTVVLSMVPLLAFGTAVLKGLGAGGQMRQAAYAFVDQLDKRLTPQSIVIPEDNKSTEDKAPRQSAGESAGPVDDILPPDEEEKIWEEPPTPDKSEIEEQQEAVETTMTMHLKKAVDQVFDYVERTNFAALGAVGIVFLILTVLAVLGSIEQAMNVIWHTKSGRNIGRQIMDYVALVILLPITINIGLATMATLQSPTLMAWVQEKLPMGWLGPHMLNMLPFLAIIATFTLLYSFLPNTKVNFSAALAGGFFGSVFWLLAQIVYIKMQLGVARYNAIYGSFATLPLFLLWLYVGWVIFLAGAEMSFATQVWRRYHAKNMKLKPIAKLALAYNVIRQIDKDFKARHTSNRDSLVTDLKQPDIYVKGILDMLTDKEILRQVNEPDNSYVPAIPVEQIDPVEIAEMVLGTHTPYTPTNPLSIEAMNAIRKTLAGKKVVPVAGKTQNRPVRKTQAQGESVAKRAQPGDKITPGSQTGGAKTQTSAPGATQSGVKKPENSTKSA